MGLDMRFCSAKSVKDLENYDYRDWFDANEIQEDEWGSPQYPTIPCELVYFRKHWVLMHEMNHILDNKYEYGQWVRIYKKHLKAIIDFYCYHENYFNNFMGLERLCELYRDYDRMQEQGINLYFEADW